MVNVTHDGNDRSSWSLVVVVIFFLHLFHLKLFLHVDEFNIESKFTGYKFNYFRIETLVDGHHQAKAHTFSDYFSIAYIHQVGEFAYADKFGKLQLVILYVAVTCLFGNFITFCATVFCLKALTSTTGTGKLGLRFADFILNFFFIDFFLLTRTGMKDAVPSWGCPDCPAGLV